MTGSDQHNNESPFPDQALERPGLSTIVGSNVARLRTQQKLKKYVLASMAGVSRPYLNKIEKGKADLRLSRLQNLAEALGVTVCTLVTASDETTASR